MFKLWTAYRLPEVAGRSNPIAGAFPLDDHPGTSALRLQCFDNFRRRLYVVGFSPFVVAQRVKQLISQDHPTMKVGISGSHVEGKNAVVISVIEESPVGRR